MAIGLRDVSIKTRHAYPAEPIAIITFLQKFNERDYDVLNIHEGAAM